jgi:hypothetical protein
MQRTRRGLEIQEIVEAFNAIIEIICECYNHPLRERFETCSTQIGRDVTKSLLERKILERYSDIGWRTQRLLLDKGIIETGGINKEDDQ